MNTNLIIRCGLFSYAEIPKLFQFIMGVTGTLESLNKFQKDIIENEYHIKRTAMIPSIYGKDKSNVFNGDSDIQVVFSEQNELGFFNSISKEIKDRKAGINKSVLLPVLVFFDSNETIKSILKSNAIASYAHDINIINEETEEKNRASLITRSTNSGQITFLTRDFCRGTDFKCYEDVVNANGGVQVIQTFLSEEKSEEIQCKGRTARQGENGK